MNNTDDRYETVTVPMEPAEEFRVHKGTSIIASPGKFEGEQTYVPFLWAITLDGGVEIEGDEGEEVYVVEVEEGDVALFPALAGRKEVRLYERSDGFVCELK